MSQQDNALWYKDAVIYELRLSSFADSNGDGIGDFPGLTARLDYLRDLGITTIWLLPFYPSPLRDDGYDIADYMAIHPMYGTLDDFRTFLAAAHQRGLRVISELVINHTSDQHAWFQRARQAPPGSPERDYYVWSDSPERYQAARIIFKDFETSNWTWDPVAQAYYWHRFYHHQPDLNFDNPAVLQELLRVASFWLNLGVDGLRLDAIPYLYEREGTTCENLPETHTFLRQMRQHIDAHFPNRMLLAEANQWPHDAVAYFGDGDECHMAFHFPLMPRLFIALRMEDRFPIIDALAHTPPIPESCQWALFLRNHDELTLEMVTAEERSFMYRIYASNPRSRVNLGIRRRLAPLLQNDRRQIELLNMLLFALPGTPVIYYGDEIGMGDNIYLGDRDSVRTPMQWSPARNAGFSDANPQQIVLPINIDPEYTYQTINVETQEANSVSLLHWMRRLIATRKRHPALSRGSLTMLEPENRHVLAFLRDSDDEHLLVVANLSHAVQYVALDLTMLRGRSPVELFDRAVFPPIGEQPYPLSLAPYTCYWFVLEPQHRQDLYQPQSQRIPTLTVRDNWRSVMGDRDARQALEAELVPYLQRQPWFQQPRRMIRMAAFQDIIPLPEQAPSGYLTLVQVIYGEGDTELYLLPITYDRGIQADTIWNEAPQTIVARLLIEQTGQVGILYDALHNPAFAGLLWQAISAADTCTGQMGTLMGSCTESAPEYKDALRSIVVYNQSNTTLIYNREIVVKYLRRLEAGPHPEAELHQHLYEQVAFAYIAAPLGLLSYQQRREPAVTLAVASPYLEHRMTGWQQAQDDLSRYFERVLSADTLLQTLPIPEAQLLTLAAQPTSPLATELIDSYLTRASRIGQRTAELHSALATPTTDPALTPEPFTDFFQRPLYYATAGLLERDLGLLQAALPQFSAPVAAAAQQLISRGSELLGIFAPFRDRRIAGVRIRCHGNYHLGELLCTDDEVWIIDFEGPAQRSLDERRQKDTPWSDVATLLYSLHTAVWQALANQEQRGVNLHTSRMAEYRAQVSWARFWYMWVAAALLRGYWMGVNQSQALQEEQADAPLLLDAYFVARALYDLGQVLPEHPDRAVVPIQALLGVLEGRVYA